MYHKFKHRYIKKTMSMIIMIMNMMTMMIIMIITEDTIRVVLIIIKKQILTTMDLKLCKKRKKVMDEEAEVTVVSD